MKMNKILVTALTLATVFACNDKEPNESPKKGSTFASITLATEGAKFRGETENTQNDQAGKAEESKVSSIGFHSSFEDLTFEGAAIIDKGSGVFTVKPWNTNPGGELAAIVVNKPASLTLSYQDLLNEKVFGGNNPVQDIADLSTDNKFVMSSNEKTITIQKNVSEQDCAQGNDNGDAQKNVFTFNCERVVCKGIIQKGANLKATTTKPGDNLAGAVDLATLKFAAVNGATKTYLFGKKAGERTIDANTKKYNGYTSVIDDLDPIATPVKDPAAAKAQGLLRLGNISQGLTATSTPAEIKAKLGGYAAKDLNASGATDNAIYFMENSGSLSTEEAFGGEIEQVGYYRFAYAKIYATYTPNKIYQRKANPAQAGQYLDELELVDWANRDKAQFTPVAGKDENTFFRGEFDNLLYISKAAAALSPIKKGQKAFTYKNGRCGYRTLWNKTYHNFAERILKNVSTRRNNTYIISITEFYTIGFPWDSSDPNDPYLPKDEDDPTPDNGPDDPTIESTNTYMRVVAKVLPWNVLSREDILN